MTLPPYPVPPASITLPPTGQKYVSQLGEDCLLAIFFEFKRSGYFVDVGAFDGLYLSNTYFFEQIGWSGLCVEADPRYFDLCARNRPRSKCINAACLERDQGSVSFRVEEGGLFSGVGTDEDFAASIYRNCTIPFEGFRTISVPSTSLNTLLDAHAGAIDFASIDVEGAELQVLRGFDLERFAPRVLVLEANKPEELRDLVSYLGERGYRLARSMAWNHFFVRTKRDVRRCRAIGFTALLERPVHPLGRLYNRIGDAVGPLVQWPAVR
jgi:FkbM family methyltransferase